MSTQSTPSPAMLAPNGQPKPAARKFKAPSNPLVKPRRPGQARGPTSAPTQRGGGAPPLLQNGLRPAPQRNQNLVNLGHDPMQVEEEYEDIPIFTTRRAMLEGTRHHIMRLFPNTNVERKDIDPSDSSQFTRPVKLHRRDPRTDPSQHWRQDGTDTSEQDIKDNIIDDKAREEAALAKAERRAQREAVQAQIAPTAKSEAAKKRKPNQKKTELVYQFTDSLTKEKNKQIRYEESLPWHLEDFDNKNMWAGTYEAAMSERHIMLVQEPESKSVRMVPLEKWYKFIPKSHFKTLSIEQAEAQMSKKQNAPRWFQRAVDVDQKTKVEQEKSAMGKIFTRQGERGERAVRPTANGTARDNAEEEKIEQAQDADIIDYDYEEAFADDEENALFGGDDEENKEAEEKLKRERAEANVFDIKEEKDYDEEEEEEKRRLEEEKEKARKTKKALMKREKNYDYEDGSESDSDTSEEEEEASEKKDEQNDKDGGKEKSLSNEAYSKGTSTPRTDDSKQRITLKRAVSPEHSDASGNESSRKKRRKTHITNALNGGPSNSRSTSPVAETAGSRRNSTIKLNMGARKIGTDRAGSGSEGEMSDGTRRNKSGAKVRSGTASPNTSRQGSPVNGSSNAPAEPPYPLPAVEDLIALVGKEGVTLQRLREIYPKRLFQNQDFVPLMRTISKWIRAEQKFIPKPTESKP